MERGELGRLGEEAAVKWLSKEGYKVLARNVNLLPVGELDIVAERGGTIHFFEVRTARRGSPVSPLESLGHQKLRKLRRAVETGLKPILCVGEKLEERERGLTEKVIERQLVSALEGLSREDLNDLVVAYEPVWAIGTGKNATPEQAQEVHAFIRHRLSELYGDKFADSRTILYGGSVKPHNICELTKERDVDGALVGGASLSAESFLGIIEKAYK